MRRATTLLLATAAAVLLAQGAAAEASYAVTKAADAKDCSDTPSYVSVTAADADSGYTCAAACVANNPATIYINVIPSTSCVCWTACTTQTNSTSQTSVLYSASYTMTKIATGKICFEAPSYVSPTADDAWNKYACSTACQAASANNLYFNVDISTTCACWSSCTANVTASNGASELFQVIPGSTVADPHVMGFHGHKYAFCEEQDGKPCHGRAFSVLSESMHALNARVTRLAGPDQWPYAGTWMTGMGFKFADVLSLELEMATDVTYDVQPDPARGLSATRAAIPTDWAGVFAGVRANGVNIASKLGSGKTLEFGAGAERATVFFPSARHSKDATDGAVAVVTTPDMQARCGAALLVKLYLESEDITHLDYEVMLTPKTRVQEMHGILGQSLSWPSAAPASFQGGDMDYAVDGLLATAFKYGRFTGKPAAAAARRTLLSTSDFALLRGGSM
ncbi:MAG: hypothetical protein J3K34DRAFT_489375 [Monoraphidium minutum]|nr:MAG: hypothetical protein J3K34DRAFT_489375 [Monoraphidium minutum]